MQLIFYRFVSIPSKTDKELPKITTGTDITNAGIKTLMHIQPS
jgi:hypothetical protein